MSGHVIEVEDEAAMVALGIALSQSLVQEAAGGLAIYLSGELGAGKTTLARGVARGLGHRGAVKSPTYTLVEPYLELEPRLFHFDLYRLGNPEELEFMGLRDYFDVGALVLVEWPERGGAFLPAPDLEITIAVAGVGRRVTLIPHSEAGRRGLQTLQAA